jgi:hypothetical protein
MEIDDSLGDADPGLRALLESFARGSAEGDAALPWAERLSPRDRERLRGDLTVVLSEPGATGEPLDWREIGDILQEWAGVAGWDGTLIRSTAAAAGRFCVEIRPREAAALASAPAAVQRAARTLLEEFLTAHPTAGDLLPRGRLKKLANREIWQLGLPDGYRLRYFVDEPGRIVYVVYLGPHPDGDASGREQAVRSRVHTERRTEARRRSADSAPLAKEESGRLPPEQ